MKEAFDRHTGRLTVESQSVRFDHPDVPLEIKDIEAVDYGVFGATTNPSVRIRYRADEGIREAYFEDARYLGWGGMMGGTQRIAEVIQHPGTTIDDERAVAIRNRLLAIGAAALLMLALRLLF